MDIRWFRKSICEIIVVGFDFFFGVFFSEFLVVGDFVFGRNGDSFFFFFFHLRLSILGGNLV